ncbi:MAG: kinase [Herpetosiphonaceae bacterium]|nr:MAG: kinase [Herpetosiphonaceae bacterium]
MHQLPEQFTRTIVDLHEDAGVEWLNQLPQIIAECERRWSISVLPPFANLSYNYVAPAMTADGREVVLKLGVPNLELTREITALRYYDGRGIVQLLDSDPEKGILLQERLHPDTLLSSLADDEQATSIAAAVMRRLWRPAPPEHPFPTVADWAGSLRKLRAQFAGETGPLPAQLVDAAEGLFAELIDSMAEPVLLHGDLHHDNIMAAEREPWLALDPKGVIGEPAYEVGALLRNPIAQIASMPNLRGILARRVDQLAEELELDRDRLIGWGFAQAVLSAWWSIEDHNSGWQQSIVCAEQLYALLR